MIEKTKINQMKQKIIKILRSSGDRIDLCEDLDSFVKEFSPIPFEGDPFNLHDWREFLNHFRERSESYASISEKSEDSELDEFWVTKSAQIAVYMDAFNGSNRHYMKIATSGNGFFKSDTDDPATFFERGNRRSMLAAAKHFIMNKENLADSAIMPEEIAEIVFAMTAFYIHRADGDYATDIGPFRAWMELTAGSGRYTLSIFPRLADVYARSPWVVINDKTSTSCNYLANLKRRVYDAVSSLLQVGQTKEHYAIMRWPKIKLLMVDLGNIEECFPGVNNQIKRRVDLQCKNPKITDYDASHNATISVAAGLDEKLYYLRYNQRSKLAVARIIMNSHYMKEYKYNTPIVHTMDVCEVLIAKFIRHVESLMGGELESSISYEHTQIDVEYSDLYEPPFLVTVMVGNEKTDISFGIFDIAEVVKGNHTKVTNALRLAFLDIINAPNKGTNKPLPPKPADNYSTYVFAHVDNVVKVVLGRTDREKLLGHYGKMPSSG